jgi:hypothetical protein
LDHLWRRPVWRLDRAAETRQRLNKLIPLTEG